jgi:hypothetical protein
MQAQLNLSLVKGKGSVKEWGRAAMEEVSPSPQNRHPERSVPAFGDAESKDPEGYPLAQTFCTFSTSNARAWTFALEKVPTSWASSSPSGSFDSAPRKNARCSAQDDVSVGEQNI